MLPDQKIDINSINVVFGKIIARHGKLGEQVQEEFFAELKKTNAGMLAPVKSAMVEVLMEDYSDISMISGTDIRANNVLKTSKLPIMVEVWDELKGKRITKQYRAGSTRNVIVDIDLYQDDGDTFYIVHDPVGICEYSTWAKVEEVFKKFKWVGSWIANADLRPKDTTVRWEEDLDEAGSMLDSSYGYYGTETALDLDFLKKLTTLSSGGAKFALPNFISPLKGSNNILGISGP